MSREMKYSGIPWIGNIPCSWDVARIKTIFKERTELSEDGSETLLSVSEYYGVANRSERVSEGEFVSRAETLVGYKKCFVGDLVSNIMLAWKGSMGITEYDGIVSPAYCVYEPSPRIYPRYYHYLFRTSLYTSIFRLYSKGIIDSRLRLYSPYFFDISAIIPSLYEQQKIASFLDRKCLEIDEMIALQEKIVEELKVYKQSVITEAVTKGLNPDVPMKNSGVEWIGEIPEHWKQCRLKNYFHLHGRIGWNGLRSDEFEESSYAYLVTGQDFKAKDIDWKKCYQIRKERYDEDPFIQLTEGDILVTKDGTIGKVAVVKNLNKPACLNSGIFVVKQYEPKCFDSGYVYWLLVSPLLKTFNDFLNLGGTTIIHLYQNVFERMPLVLPPLEEQQAIANHLDKICSEIDSLIRIKESKIDSLKEYKKSIIYEYVTGKKEITE